MHFNIFPNNKEVVMRITKRTVSLYLVALVGIAMLLGIFLRTPLEAASESVIEAKEVLASKIPTFKATAYIAGHGGHLSIIDMNTMKAPTDIEKDRIVLTEAGSEMEGKIAGMDFEAVKKSGGSHGQAFINKNVLVASTLAGDVYKIDLKTGKKEGPYKVGKKFCGTILGQDGNIYLEDMADGNVYVWDPKTLKTVDKMPIGKAVCGIQWTKNNKKAYISDMPTGIVYVYDWTTKKKIKEITSAEGLTFIHQMRMTPDGKELWVAGANEFGPGLTPRTKKPQVVIIDTAKDEIVKRIILPDDVVIHDYAFTKDGKYAFLSARTNGRDDSLMHIMDRSNYNIVGKVSACGTCHKANGVEVRIDGGSPQLCGIEINWQ
jgi:hypothetical protein